MASKLRSIDSTVVISALIALTGTVLTVIFSANFLSEILLNPSVYIQVINNGTTTVPRMIITNDGSQPADNMHIFIQTSNRMINITNVFSTTDVSLVKPTQQALERSVPVPVNSNFSEIHIPKLIQGSGSIVEIETLLESQGAYYNVYAVYDQGSTMGNYEPNVVLRFVNTSFPSLGSMSIWGWAGLVFLLIVTVGQFGYLLAKRREKRRKAINLVMETIRNMRRLIIDNPTITQPLNMDLAELREELASVFKNLHDYMIIDDLVSKLYKRNERIKELESKGTPIHPIDLGMINKELLDLIN